MGNIFGFLKNLLARINRRGEMDARDDQMVNELIGASPEINTGPETNAFFERRVLPPRAARDKSIFGGRSDTNNLKIKGPHSLRAKRCLSCDSGMDRNKASVSKRGPTIETTMNSRQVASPENTSGAERNSRDKRSINAFGERRVLPPRLAKEKSVFVIQQVSSNLKVMVQIRPHVRRPGEHTDRKHSAGVREKTAMISDEEANTTTYREQERMTYYAGDAAKDKRGKQSLSGVCCVAKLQGHLMEITPAVTNCQRKRMFHCYH
uniref:Uncharacterized protein n=1 Tax=Glossina pallidipes TaxID=7398 RepID=A0A1B0A816_GLOPL